MTETDLRSLLQAGQTIEQHGINVAKGLADRTVWDAHATENATHAVISAPNEEAARVKSIDQIEDIKRHVTTEDVILDLGCGYGRVAQYLLPQLTVKAYVGADSSLEMLTLFKNRYVRNDEEQKTPVLFLNADIHTVPLNSASVDVVLVCAVFLHNHKDIVKKAMVEVKRVLKPGGTMLVYSSFPRTMTLMGLQGVLYQALLNVMGKPFKNGPVRYYRKKEISDLFAGFETVDIIPVGFGILPKTLIFLPKPLEVVYRVGISKPVNSLLEKLCPACLKHIFAAWYDVIAKR